MVTRRERAGAVRILTFDLLQTGELGLGHGKDSYQIAVGPASGVRDGIPFEPAGIAGGIDIAKDAPGQLAGQAPGGPGGGASETERAAHEASHGHVVSGSASRVQRLTARTHGGAEGGRR